MIFMAFRSTTEPEPPFVSSMSSNEKRRVIRFSTSLEANGMGIYCFTNPS